MEQRKLKRGDIYYADLNPVIGSEQGDYRPVLIIQNDIGNEYSPTVVVLPITSKIDKNHLPTHVHLPKSCGLEKDSIILTEQIQTIDRSRLAEYICHISGEIWVAIDKAIALCVGLENCRSKKGEMMMLSLCTRCEMDFRNSGYVVVKRGWQEVKEDCDFCKIGRGLNFGVFSYE